MFVAFVLLVTSVIVIVFLLIHKIYEIRKGDKTFISRGILPKSDSILQSQIDLHTEVFVEGGKRGLKVVANLGKEGGKHIFMSFLHFLHEKLTSLLIKLRRKGFKKQHGVSFFLKRMGNEGEGKSKNPASILPSDFEDSGRAR